MQLFRVSAVCAVLCSAGAREGLQKFCRAPWPARFIMLQGIEGVEDIKDGYNPATWALEVTNQTSERRIGRDFADVYESSDVFKWVSCPHLPLQLTPSIGALKTILSAVRL